MASIISKTLTVTRVSYQIVEVHDGVPAFVARPDAVFRGIQPQERVLKLLRNREGKDAIIVITKMDAKQHRFVMSMEQFVLNAEIADEADESELQEEDADAAEDDDDEVSDVGEEFGDSGEVVTDSFD